jgi:hypothetical protein
MADRIFRAPDGAELREEDVRALLPNYIHAHNCNETCRISATRILAALAPKTCGAILPVMVQNVGSGGYSGPQRCVLPPNHQGAHQVAPELWRES